MSSSADTTPISAERFAAALKDLSVEMMQLKVLEIHNSIAHLQYSNDQLWPFAEGFSAATSSPVDATATALAPAEPDQDCVDAIRENKQVIDRMVERIAIIRIEVEERGVSWTEFQSKEEAEAAAAAAAQSNEGKINGAAAAAAPAEEGTNGAGNATSSPWTDGTFQTGTISNGEVRFDSQPGRPEAGQQQGGSLSDEQLRRALEERIRQMGGGDDDDGTGDAGGMHL